MMDDLYHESMCSNCHRVGESRSHGAAINSQGCTGACLQWAREIIEDSHRILTAFGYELTRSRWPHVVACFRIVVSNINELGCAYLFWACEGGSPDFRCKYDWIERARERYCEPQKFSHSEVIQAWWAVEGREFRDLVNTLYQQCLQLRTVVYTLRWVLPENGVHHVRITGMNGETVSQASMSRGEPLQAWKHVPLPFYRVAADGNLYSFEDYAAYYGEDMCEEFWTRDAPCYDYLIHLIAQNGDMLQLFAPIMTLPNETD